MNRTANPKEIQEHLQFEKFAKDIAEELMIYALLKGKDYAVDDVAVGVLSSQSTDDSVENGEIVQSEKGISNAINVTIFAGDKKISVERRGFDLDVMKEAIDQNLPILAYTPSNPHTRILEAEHTYRGPKVDLDLWDDTTISADDIKKQAVLAEQTARAHDKIKAIRSVSYDTSRSKTYVASTSGFEGFNYNTSFGATASVIAEFNGNMQNGYAGMMARHMSDLESPIDLGERATQKAVLSLNPETPKTGDMPIVLSPQAAQTFFNSVMEAIDGGEIRGGRSYMKDMLGSQVLPSNVTIIDNPLIQRGLRSSYVDSAGQFRQPLTFIRDGVLEQFNLSVEEARALGYAPIGRNNGRTNTSVIGGTKTAEELIAGIKEGLYIESFQGGTANITDGTFSRKASGRRIVNGEITDRAVSGFVLSGNLKTMNMGFEIANDTPDHPNTRTSFACPTTKFPSLKISGS